MQTLLQEKTVAETRSTESSDKPNQSITIGRRMEDQLRLRELELQTNFQIQTLTESLNLMKADFHSWREAINDQLKLVNIEVGALKHRLTIVIALIIGQMAGAPAALTKLLGG